ncbi:DUF4272 domain-containing protein [Neisseria sp. Ec49-e6-T10]|uniref:DUF4272 domain-containing protein n=1 Tax=Neisseria sp. Ec49-e6-T10 TaxID=3140744 RepID=UPI003EBEC9BF
MIKAESEAKILANGWGICHWMEELPDPNWRSIDEIKDRLCVMNALLYVAFGAPIPKIGKWLKTQGKLEALTPNEILLLKRSQRTSLSVFDRNYLKQYLESVWALLWVLECIDELSVQEACANNMNDFLPKILEDEDNNKIDQLTHTRLPGEFYELLDYYYRVHWYCVDQTKLGKKTGFPDENRMAQRRKALHWVYDKELNWDKMRIAL